MTIDDRLREHYQSRSLPPERVAALRAMRRRPRPYRWLAIAAVAASIIAALTVPRWLDQRVTREVAEQVAYNHKKGMPSDLAADSFVDLERGLDKLDFSLTPIPAVIAERFRPTGGRYCSIRTVAAAQLALDGAGPTSLYVAPITDPLERVREGAFEIGETRVTLVRDEGRLFALAESR